MAIVTLTSFVLLIVLSVACGSSAPAPPAPTQPAAVVPTTPATPATPVPTGPPKPLEGATITITAAGFTLDSTSAASFSLNDLHVYQGARLLFINNDLQTHDVLSDPLHIHTDCPELNTAGFLTPGQSRSTDPLNRLVTCGFHDHTHEADPAFAGKVTAEPR